MGIPSVPRTWCGMLVVAIFPLLSSCGIWTPNPDSPVQRVEITGSAIKRVDFEDGPVWNAWASRDGIDAKRLQVDKRYIVSLDLSAASYDSEAEKVTVSAEMRAMIDEAPASASFIVRPYAVGQGLSLDKAGDYVLKLDAAKLRSLIALNKDGRRIELNDDESRSKVAVSDRWGAGRIDVPITTSADGPKCAQVIFTIWNETGRRPLDEIVLTLAIDNGSDGLPSCHSGKFQGGRTSLMGLLAPEPPEPAKAAFDLFEYFDPDLERVTTAMFLATTKQSVSASQASNETTSLYVWSPTVPPAEYLRGPMVPMVDEARKSADYSTVAGELRSRLFSDRTAKGREVAKAAFTALEELTADPANEPWITMRTVGRGNSNYWIPLQLMGASGGPLKGPPKVLYPLYDTRAKSTCIRHWTVVAPDYLDGLGLVNIKDADLDSSMTRLRTVEELSAFLGTDPSSAGEGRSAEGLLFLGHQAQGQVWFDRQPANSHFDFVDANRTFGHGSAAIVAACSVGDAKEGQNSMAYELNWHGMDAVVANPFPVNAEYAVELTKSTIAVIKAAHVGKEALTIDQVLHRAAVMATLRGGNSYRERELEFVVLGDPKSRLCGE